MIAKHGAAARDVAYSQARSSRRGGSDQRTGMWLEVVRLIATTRLGAASAEPGPDEVSDKVVAFEGRRRERG